MRAAVDEDSDGGGGGQPGAKRQRRAVSNALTDDRFGAMFQDREFEIDMDSEEYKQLHPNAGVLEFRVITLAAAFQRCCVGFTCRNS